MVVWRRGSARRGPGGGVVTVGTVVAMLAALGVTLFGVGAAEQTLASYDVSSWLWSSGKGEVARVNGVTGRVDTRYRVADAEGHQVQVSQNDRYVVLRDVATGTISVLDLATLQVGASTQAASGLGIAVAMSDRATFVIDSVQGVVRQLDPGTLQPVGEALRFMPGVSGGSIDADGRLWLLVPGEGTVVAVRPAPTRTAAATVDRPAAGGPSAGPGAGPAVVRTETVAPPAHELALSVLDTGVAVLDRTAATLTTLRGTERRTVTLPVAGAGQLPPRTGGGAVPVTVPDDRHVYVVSGDKVSRFTVPGDSPRLGPCVAWSGRLYCPDDATGTVYVLDEAGRPAASIEIPNHGGAPLELEVREDRLFINAPSSSTARVVDRHGTVTTVDKYAEDVLGGDPPPAPPPPPPPPPKPQPGKPGAPVRVSATAGDAQATVVWGPAPANGSTLQKYVVTGAGRSVDVGANQRSLVVTGLVNGERYEFSVYAVNGRGEGPAKTSNPVVPTADVPDAPTGVTAGANPDGTVAVRWAAANGQGRRITRYTVTAVSTDGREAVGDATGTSLTVAAGGGKALAYGTQYAFVVTAVNDRGASSTASAPSPTVVPFSRPDRPAGVRAVAPNARGTLTVSWSPSADNGRPVTGYLVTAGPVTREVHGGTSTQLTGLPDGATVTVGVVAVNEAGRSDPASTVSRTVAPPTLTLTGSSTTVTSLTVRGSVVDNGSPATCQLAVQGAGTAKGACSGLTVTGLRPGTSYGYTVTATNVAGGTSATGNASTPGVYGIAVCENNLSSSDPAQHTWCDDYTNGREIHSAPNDSPSSRVGRADQYQRIQALCTVTGQTISAYVYNRGKNDTNLWVRVPWGGGTGYMSFAWLNLEGYGINDIGPVPPC